MHHWVTNIENKYSFLGFLSKVWSPVFLCLSFSATFSTAKAEVSSPPQMEAWKSWVSHDLEHLKCAQREGLHQCIWPSDLAISLGVQEAKFEYDFSMGEEGLAPLLNDARLSIDEVILLDYRVRLNHL